MENTMKLHANLAAAWYAMPRYMKAGLGATVTMALISKYDAESLNQRDAYDAIVHALPKNMGAMYYLGEVIKIGDDEDKEMLKGILAELEGEDD